MLERDRLPAVAEPRPGVPQGRHLHILLCRWRVILEELFPGLEADLVVAYSRSSACQRREPLRTEVGLPPQ